MKKNLNQIWEIFKFIFILFINHYKTLKELNAKRKFRNAFNFTKEDFIGVTKGSLTEDDFITLKNDWEWMQGNLDVYTIEDLCLLKEKFYRKKPMIETAMKFQHNKAFKA
jgi:hypothetical protein